MLMLGLMLHLPLPLLLTGECDKGSLVKAVWLRQYGQGSMVKAGR